MTSADEQRLLADLREAGYDVESVWLWILKPPRHYLGAGEILTRHLASATDDRLIDCLAKLVSHEEFCFAVPTLIAKLDEVEKTTTKHSLASALLAIGVGGHQDAALRLLESNETLAIKPLLEKALHRAGVNLSEYRRREAARQQEWLRPGFGVAMLICGVASFVIVAVFWNRTTAVELAALAAYGAIELALGALLLRRSSLALPTYVAFVAVSIAGLVPIQMRTMVVSWPLFFAIAATCLATLIYFGVLLFGDNE